MIAQTGIEHRKTPPYSPQCNTVERANRTLKTMIAQFIGQDHRQWDRHLPQLTFAANTAIHESTGYTSAMLTYGQELTAPGTLRAKHEQILRDAPTDRPTARVRKIQQMRKQFEIATRRQEEATAKQARYYNLRRRNWRPDIGQHVYRREHPLSNAQEHFAGKLAPRYLGPYTVDKHISPVIVRLRDQHDKIIGTAHVKDLKDAETPHDREDI
ncbi:uncharacterized protein LOC118646910 [Monomorium pharaonis]|uniref:uncharacterized protein LOC118646910 n=1 Tax=Monomorium pharaonis TaxID=307658 RepID=UPI00174763CD|nr:uncharacterized protein LOC118646910 [Monomorium pharaonis]